LSRRADIRVTPVSGETALYAIIGDPIGQVKSPELFNAEFAKRGTDAIMVALNVTSPQLDATVRLFRESSNFRGLVVTVPHKVAVTRLVDRLETQAQRVGAVNAIRKAHDGSLIGNIFDGTGFVAGLKKAGHHLLEKRVLVLGAGGAGRAVAHAVAQCRPRSISIFDIDRERADALRSSLSGLVNAECLPAGTPSAGGFDVVVNCTPMGMRAADSLPVDVGTLRPGVVVADIVMKPAVTPLLKAAAMRGAQAHPGLPMLESQIAQLIAFFEGAEV